MRSLLGGSSSSSPGRFLLGNFHSCPHPGNRSHSSAFISSFPKRQIKSEAFVKFLVNVCDFRSLIIEKIPPKALSHLLYRLYHSLRLPGNIRFRFLYVWRDPSPEPAHNDYRTVSPSASLKLIMLVVLAKLKTSSRSTTNFSSLPETMLQQRQLRHQIFSDLKKYAPHAACSSGSQLPAQPHMVYCEMRNPLWIEKPADAPTAANN